ncbi:alanine transaminase [Hanseniaspora valbyensis]
MLRTQVKTHVKIHVKLTLKRLNASYSAPKLSLKDINPHVIEAKYAVRGTIPTKAEQLKLQLQEDPSSVAFDKIIFSNIGNPQQLNQKPITFYRKVLSILQDPSLLNALKAKDCPASFKQQYPQDIIDRAERMLKDIGSSVGAYSASQGIRGFRNTVAEFITKRDGYKADPNDIYLTGGASAAVNYVLQILCNGPKTGVLIPIPQYPLYTATLALNNSHAVPYYLKESEGWSLDCNELNNAIKDKTAEGVAVNCLVVINPGNPTGAVLSKEKMIEIVNVAKENGLVIISDEVYQENVYHGEFISMRKVLKELQANNGSEYDNIQLVSLHSTSKGVSGECGQRGGYMEILGFSDELRAIFTKLCSISLCSVVTGQALVDLMCKPPVAGESSFALDHKERLDIFNALKQRSLQLWETFNKLEGIECQKPEGAMYLFPKLDLSENVIAIAKAKGLQPDEFYCLELLENTGICTVPGSGFGQYPGTWHLRTTFLPPGTEWISKWEEFHNEFMTKYK